MGIPRLPLPVKLFVGMLSPHLDLFQTCAARLSEVYGRIESESPAWFWDTTTYYQEELGGGILRKFIFFERIIDPGLLPSIKRFTNDLEHGFSREDALGGFNRSINLDPGYVTESKVVLATTKDFSHRLYIGDSIYAEVTLRYHSHERSFLPHEFTFPDFRSKAYLELFNTAREDLRRDLNAKKAR
jgi:hypothetical protein